MARFEFAWAIMLLSACGGGATVVEPPPPPSAEYVLTLRADGEDLSTTQALGWSSGIPDADLTLTRQAGASGPVGSPLAYRTSPDGKITIPALAAGDYLVEARRILTAAERSRLPAGDDAVGFVAWTAVRVTSGVTQEVVSAPASRRRSLLISEFFNSYTHPTGNEPYFAGAYVELHNNSDTTIYVDGMLLARGLAPSIDTPNFPCSLYYAYTQDPGGVWVRAMARFPGSGREYPVLPGGTMVVATDAIDHAVIVPEGPDLRTADFEMLGAADVDNPRVPNMVDITESGPTGSHGIDWPDSGGGVTVLAAPLDASSLPRAQVQENGYVFIRLPREKVLDLLSFHTTYVGAYPICPSLIHASFDRAMAFLLLGDEYALSRQRRVAVILSDGRKIVQHSRNSNADFIASARSPGVIP